MIGLMRGLAFQAYRDTYPGEAFWMQWWADGENFGLIQSLSFVSKNVDDPRRSFPASHRYFHLVQACPLRIPYRDAQQHNPQP